MPKLPTREELGALPGVQSGSVTSVDTSQVGAGDLARARGQAALGQGLAKIGQGASSLGKAASDVELAELQRSRAKKKAADRYNTERRFQEWKFAEEQAQSERMKNIDPGAGGFAEAANESFTKSGKEFFKTVPKPLQKEYDLKLTGLRNSQLRNSKKFEETEQRRFAINDVSDKVENIYSARAAAIDSASLDTVVDDFDALLEANQLLTPIEKDKLARDKTREIALAHLNGLDPEAVSAVLGLPAESQPKAFLSLTHEDRVKAIDRAKRQKAIETRGLKSLLKDTAATAKEGILPSDDEMTSLEAQVLASGDPDLIGELAEIKGTALAYDATSRVPIGDAEAAVTAQRAKLRSEGGTRQELETLKVSESVVNKARTQLKVDPISWTEQSGMAEPTNVDFTNPETVAVSLKQRVPVAEDIGNFHSIQPKYLKPSEKQALSKASLKSGEDLLALTGSIVTGGGDAAPQILAEIFEGGRDKTSQSVAMLGGLMTLTGATQFARDSADGFALANSDDFKSLAPPANVVREISLGEMGLAFSELPKTEQAVMGVAKAAYEVRARRAGIDGSKQEQFDTELWNASLREAVGEREIDGQIYGGFLDTNASNWFGESNTIVVPPNIKRDAFGDVISAIRIEDLVDDRPRHGDGTTTVTMSELRRGQLKNIGAGKYLVNMGDSDQPEYLLSENGGKWVLDLNALEPKLRARVGSSYLDRP